MTGAKSEKGGKAVCEAPGHPEDGQGGDGFRIELLGPAIRALSDGDVPEAGSSRMRARSEGARRCGPGGHGVGRDHAAELLPSARVDRSLHATPPSLHVWC